MTRTSTTASLLLAAALSVPAFPEAHAQGYPVRPIRVLSIFTPGSVADGAIRIVGEKMAVSMGQPVVVEVQAGAGGLIAAQNLVRAAPDGYTILHCTPSALVSVPFLQKNPPYDPLKDFTYVTRLVAASIALAATESLPVATVKELIAYARANPGKLSYGSNGVGATQHLEMELLKQKQGLDITHIPYKGGSLGLMAAAAGEVHLAFAPVASVLSQARAGKVKVLAVMSAKRYAAFPDIPSMGEQISDYEQVPTSDEIVGPASLPAAVVARLNAEIVKALKLPDVLAYLSKIGFIPVGNTPEEEAAQLRRDMDIFARGRKAAGITAQ